MGASDVTALDGSVIIAGLLAWHEAHSRAFTALTTAINEAERVVIPAPALVEAYAVMTRLPAPHRLPPGDAIDLLSGSFEGRTDIVALSGDDTWALLHDAVGEGIAGGRTYDALILRCALSAGATRLVTLDRTDFTRLDPGDLSIVIPE